MPTALIRNRVYTSREVNSTRLWAKRWPTNIYTKRALSIWASGRADSDMARGAMSGPIKDRIRAPGTMARLKERASFSILMGTCIKAYGIMIYSMGLECSRVRKRTIRGGGGLI